MDQTRFDIWPWLWPWPLTRQGRKLGSALQVHEENTCTKFHQNPVQLWRIHLTLAVTLTFDWQDRKLGSALQVHEENTCTKLHQNLIRHYKWTRHHLTFEPWLWPWPFTDRAESWVLHIQVHEEEYLYQVSSKSHQALQSYGPDTILTTDLLTVTLTFDRQGRKLDFAHQVHEENTVPSFIKIPSGIAKLWTRHDLKFDLDCDLDLWPTGPKVRFCTSGPWEEYLYQVSSKSHQALQSYGPDMIWHSALTVTLTFSWQGQKLGSALQVHEENTCTKFHQNQIRHRKVMDWTRFVTDWRTDIATKNNMSPQGKWVRHN